MSTPRKSPLKRSRGTENTLGEYADISKFPKTPHRNGRIGDISIERRPLQPLAQNPSLPRNPSAIKSGKENVCFNVVEPSKRTLFAQEDDKKFLLPIPQEVSQIETEYGFASSIGDYKPLQAPSRQQTNGSKNALRRARSSKRDSAPSCGPENPRGFISFSGELLESITFHDKPTSSIKSAAASAMTLQHAPLVNVTKERKFSVDWAMKIRLTPACEDYMDLMLRIHLNLNQRTKNVDQAHDLVFHFECKGKIFTFFTPLFGNQDIVVTKGDKNKLPIPKRSGVKLPNDAFAENFGGFLKKNMSNGVTCELPFRKLLGSNTWEKDPVFVAIGIKSVSQKNPLKKRASQDGLQQNLLQNKKVAWSWQPNRQFISSFSYQLVAVFRDTKAVLWETKKGLKKFTEWSTEDKSRPGKKEPLQKSTEINREDSRNLRQENSRLKELALQQKMRADLLEEENSRLEQENAELIKINVSMKQNQCVTCAWGP